MNTAALTERLIQAAVDYEKAEGFYASACRTELSEARAALEDEINRLQGRLRKIETEARAVISEWKSGFDSNRLPSALRDLEAELTETA